MPWFEHQHYWRPKTDLNIIKDPATKSAVGGLIIEDCSCGAVRQIEFRPDVSPIIRVTEAPCR